VLTPLQLSIVPARLEVLLILLFALTREARGLGALGSAKEWWRQLWVGSHQRP